VHRDELLAAGWGADTDAVLIVKNGHTVVERYRTGSPQLIKLRSITKIFTGLAIGMLITEGRITSIDETMSKWFPEWIGDPQHAAISLRHVLTHTSGLWHEPGDRLMGASPDYVAFASKIAVVDPPGTVYAYNNDAGQLLSRVVQQSAGEPLDTFIARRVFQPLGITNWNWHKDRAGNVAAHAGLSLAARDLARVGQMLLQDGEWHGSAVIPRAWLRDATAPQPVTRTYGWLWAVRQRNETSDIGASHFFPLLKKALHRDRRTAVPAP